MAGRRVYPKPDGSIGLLEPGDYGFLQGAWYGKTPNGYSCNLRGHRVTEHEDGTITVAPSILVRLGSELEVWHGFLERGVWRSV